MKKVILAQDLRLNGTTVSERRGTKLVGTNGELNASNRRDQLHQVTRTMAALSSAAQEGFEVANNEEDATTKEEIANARYEAVMAAFDDDRQHRELGQFIGQELYLAGNRDGFCRRFMILNTLGRGQTAHATLRNKNNVAILVTSPSRVETQIVRDKDFYPPEFYLQTRVYIEKRDLDRTNADVLQEKYIEATEGIMVQEDRSWRQAALATVGEDNPLTYMTGSVTPLALGRLRNQVARWNIPAKWWLIANDIWTDIAADPGFQQVIDQVSKFELLKNGVIGRIMGLEVITDAYRHPQHKVLNQGEQWVIGSEINHGMMTDRGGIDVEPLTVAQENIPGKGWHMYETISILIANSRSLAQAIRM